MSWKKRDRVIGQGNFIVTLDAAHNTDHRIDFALIYAKGHEEVPVSVDLGFADFLHFLPFRC